MHSRKRTHSPGPASSGTKATKKLQASPAPVVAPPPLAQTLKLSTLIWQWMPRSEPCTIQMGDTCGPTPLARYVAGPAGPIAAPIELSYTRKTFTGTASSDITYYGTIAGTHYGGGSIGPLLRLHHAGEPAFVATLPAPERPWVDVDGPVRCGPGAPYDFFETDWLNNDDADRTLDGFIGRMDGAFELGIPDLPGQDGEDEPVVFGHDSDDDEAKHVEPDAAKHNGWSGPWVAALLDKEKRKVDLGTRVEVQWGDNGLWGVEFGFKPISFEPYWPDSYVDSGEESSPGSDDVTPNLAAYTVEATVRRIFVKPEWFGDEDDEDEP
ncbi:hypothetical protein AURDEDRAFT_161274 [Auricularia subglabra TFB-10046 SS5]|nr:hypothetical protein AURDEDRAFT_161274 [Auricularia subglabra TFB-10046 SS5]